MVLFFQSLTRFFYKSKTKPLLRLSLVAFVLMLAIPMSGFAQKRSINGRVISATDQLPLPGVNIVIKGSTTGTITDFDGNYRLDAATGDVFVVSFVGYKSQEVTVGAESVINVALTEDIADLDEIVIIGYGVQKKKLVTGATAQVDGEELQKRNSTNALQALQGQTAGINITSTSGQPGESMKVVIRGVGTTGNSTPLYIVDGIQTGDINHLNSSDIERIDVLKDAASAAIYGSRAANGVVLVTTKKGKEGSSKITFDAFYGYQNRAKKIDMLNSKEYAMIMNEQHLNSGGVPTKLPFDLNNLPAYTSKGVADNDWVDEIFVDNAVTQNYSLGFMGGSKTSTYSTSLSYTGTEGIVGGKDLSNYDRYSARINSEHKMYNDRVKIGQNLTFAYTKRIGVGVGGQYNNSLRSAFNVSPLLPMYNDAGEFFNSNDKTIVDQNGKNYWLNTEANPYAAMTYDNQNDRNHQKLIGSIFAEFEIIENLKFRTSFGIDYSAEEYRRYYPIYELSMYSFRKFSAAEQRMEKGLKWALDNVLTYNLTLGENKIDLMAGMSAEDYKGAWLRTVNADVAFSDLDHAYIGNTTNADDIARLTIQGAPNSRDKILSYFGRVQYNLKETYMFNATVRADGSSKFAKDNRWGYFPSVSAGWVLSNESFLEPAARYMSFLKIRASWGQNGNQSIESHQYLAPIRFTNATYPFGSEEAATIGGAYPERLPNEKIQWETSEQLNIGFDSRFLDNKLEVNVDWYKKTTKDWLVLAPILATAGTDAPYINGGNAINKGFEMALSYTDNLGAFNYSVSANGAFNKNEIEDIPTDDGIIHGASNTLYDNSLEFYRAEEGHPVGYFWGYKTDGLFQNTNDVTSYTNTDGKIIQPNAKPGDFRYKDQNDDGVIDDKDKVDLGDPNPNFVYGLNLSCNYKGIDFSISANGVLGNQVVQSYRNHTNLNANYTTEFLGRWTGEGTSNSIPRVTNGNVNYLFSDFFVRDADYLRINNVTLGYDISKVIKNKVFSQCRIYASVQNLYTFTDYSGMDPEVGFGYDNGDTDKFSSGIDLGYYPRPRTVLFGVNLKF